MRKLIFIITPLSLILLILAVFFFVGIDPSSDFAKTEFAHGLSFIKNMNSIGVKSKNIDLKDITILWNKNIIYSNGHINHAGVDKSYYHYGTNIFTVKVKDKIISEYVQYKFNNWHFHKYNFNLSDINNIISCNFYIIGVDDYYRTID